MTHHPNTWRRLAALAVLAAAAAGAAWLLIPPYRGNLQDYRPATKICDRHGRLLRVALGRGEVLSDPIPFEQTGDWAAKALVAGEDKRFYRHGGVDALAVARAAWYNLARGRIVSGASTISMLVCKLTEPRPRTLWTKIVEADHARRLESRLSKEQILEQYLNRAPFGGNLVGIEAAARRYFGKSAADLSLPEAALLVGLPQAPARLRPDRHPDRAIRRRNYILDRMNACGFITGAEHARALGADPAAGQHPAPFLAPHFCDLVAATSPRRPTTVTSLDLDLQATAERALRARLDELRADGVRGGAVVVLDVQAGEVRALVGSPDYTSVPDDGQVNGATARRSPGSALKPFIYAMALDEGLCSPGTVVADIPVSFAGYRPENFDRGFRGPVTVRDALVQSLNIPALLFVQELGLAGVVGRLRAAGLSTLDRGADHYGLSLAIGTCEVTLLELANAYACLARRGVYRDAACLVRTEPGRETRLFSEEAAYLVADILGGEERGLDAHGHVADVRCPRAAWKTGTSAGNRDAWCLAYNPEYVVGVWIGNPGGKGAPALVGAAAAAPVAHGIFRRLYPSDEGPWFQRPPGLKTRQVCRATGLKPNALCPDTVSDDAIPGVTACAACDVHRLASDGETVCEVWPADVAAFLKSSGLAAARQQIASPVLPGSADENPDRGIAAQLRPVSPVVILGEATDLRGMNSQPIRITAPARNEIFHLADDSPFLKQELSFRAVSGQASADLYWFVDGRLYRQAGADAGVPWPLSRGRHVITCCDARGQGDRVEITVE